MTTDNATYPFYTNAQPPGHELFHRIFPFGIISAITSYAERPHLTTNSLYRVNSFNKTRFNARSPRLGHARLQQALILVEIVIDFD
jgi:hypothetical protein